MIRVNWGYLLGMICFLMIMATCNSYPLDRQSQNLGFESETIWNVLPYQGATGNGVRDITQKHSGTASVKLIKNNGVGYLDLRLKVPVHVDANTTYTFRTFFHSKNVSLSSLLLMRVSNKPNDDLYYDAIDGGDGWTSQSLLRNSLPNHWEKRLITYRSEAEQDIYLHLLLYGNPCTVWVDDLEFQRDVVSLEEQPGTSYPWPFTEQQVLDTLTKRRNAIAKIGTQNGKAALIVDGIATSAVLYKSTDSTEQLGDFQGFGGAGIGLAINKVQVGPNTNEPSQGLALWQGKDRYNFEVVDRAIRDVLRKNPQANIILELALYPYQSWGKEHPTEIQQNAKGERAYDTSEGALPHYTSDVTLVETSGSGKFWIPSPYSAAWRGDLENTVAAIANHLKASPYGKAVVGFFFSGGQDGQWWSQDDYSVPSQVAFREWCRNRHGTIRQLNSRWQTDYKSFENIQVPALSRNQEESIPHLRIGALSEYREFQEAKMWQIRNDLARIAKQNITKDIITLAYATPYNHAFATTTYLDGIGGMTHYPFRVSGHTTGWKPLSANAFKNKLLFQEVDLRSYASDLNMGAKTTELHDAWIGRGRTFEEWRAIHRKLAGISIANNYGYWYYDFYQYFHKPELKSDIAKVRKIAQQVLEKSSTRFRPDVCIVLTNDANHYISSKDNIVANGNGVADIGQMMLETSGVPYDVNYLQDVLTKPELQNYKVYLFWQNAYIPKFQQAKIHQKLQRDGKTLVWLYNTGYVTEDGKSVQQMSELTGIKLATREEYQRLTPILTTEEPLLQNAQPFVGMSELTAFIFGSKSLNPRLVSRAQPFWAIDPSAKVLAKYAETGQVAIALKKFAEPNWTSIYSGAPQGLTDDFLNFIAQQADAYAIGSPGQSVQMNENFMSLHGMKSGQYKIKLPPGKNTVLDADTGRVLARNVSHYSASVEAQKTYWYLFQ